MKAGLICDIYKHKGRSCSTSAKGAGISENFDEVLLIGPDIAQVFESPELPRVMLKPGFGGAGTVRAVPVDADGKELGRGMFGGCYITGDSRFYEAVEKITGARFYGAVALHDRFE